MMMRYTAIVGIMKNATMKGLIVFDFGSFAKSKDLTPYLSRKTSSYQ
jgi:hypothetical protein